MQDGATRGQDALIVPVHDDDLLGGVGDAVRVPLARIERKEQGIRPQTRSTVPPSGVSGRQRGAVLLSHEEQVGAALDVPHARLPVETAHVDGTDVHVPDARLQKRVPEHTVRRHAVLDLAPGVVGVGLPEAAPTGNDRQDRRQVRGLRLVLRLPRQHLAVGDGVAEVGVLVAHAPP